MRLTYREAMAQYAHSVLVDAIVEAGGKDRAAKLLGLNRTHFYALCRRYEVPATIPGRALSTIQGLRAGLFIETER